MRNALLQIVGVALVVLGGQGLIRLLVDPTDAGLLAWLPGGFPAAVAGHLVALAVGVALAAWTRRSADAAQGG